MPRAANDPIDSITGAASGSTKPGIVFGTFMSKSVPSSVLMPSA